MALKIFEYSGCSTCKKALKFLADHKVSAEVIPIVEQPPTKAELKAMLSYLEADGGSLKNLFNTSGVLYKEMKLAEKLAGMSEKESLDLLSRHGKLVKRPFLLGKNFGLVGFKEDSWRQKIL
jgi:arsenate reductase